MSRQDIENAGPWRIDHLRLLAEKLGATQAILFTHSQETGTVVDTWGVDAERSAQAAAGANHIKKQWGWPEDTIVESAKVQAFRDRIAALEDEVLRLKSPKVPRAVHVIEGTEYERGWGQRPDGYFAFATEAEAKAWIENYNKTVNNKAVAPPEYTMYEYIGLKECSLDFYLKLTKKSQVFFNRLSELKE